MKQGEGVGRGGETIMDYSIYDAIRAGFGKVVFIIREDFAAQFKEIFQSKLKGNIEVDYVYQSLNSVTDGFSVPSSRVKPWGTAHAVLCAKDVIKEPFAVINADDFYGSDAFEKGWSEGQIMEAVHVASAIKGGAALVHGVQMMNKVKEIAM